MADGRIIGSVRLVERISSGIAAETWRAELRRGPRVIPVWFELIHAHVAREPDLRLRIIADARMLGRIEHPNLCRVLDAGENEGRPFIVTEQVQGSTLARLFVVLVSHGLRIHPPVAVAIAARAAAGLEAAHDATDVRGRPLGMVHGDVSPHNLLLGADGSVKLTRFGLAAVADDAALLRSSLRWMSPEQARRHPVDRRSDVFSLAAVLWEMLAGRARLDTRNGHEAMLAAAQSTPFDPPSRHRPELPASLDRVLFDALALDPAARIPTALELARRLEAACPEAASAEPGLIGELATWVESAPPLEGPTQSVATFRAPTQAFEARPMAEAASDHPARTESLPPASPEWLGDDSSRRLIAWLVIGTLLLLLLVIGVIAAESVPPIEIPP